MSENYISRQISVYKTDKKLIEFNDKLNSAPPAVYAHLHAQADTPSETQLGSDNGRKIYSNIGIVLQDYSNGKGDKTVRVTANISPDEAQFIYSRVYVNVQNFEFNLDKIFGTPDAGGYSTVTKLRIVRAPFDKDNNPRNYPWCVDIENGKGKPAKGKNGGTYCQSGSFVNVDTPHG